MTRQEAILTLGMIADNWTFLKTLHEVESNSFEVFYMALAQYPVEEVQQGIRNAIRELKKTPVVADIVEYVDDVRRSNRRKAGDVNARQAFNDAVRCTNCNDHGHIIIIYPSGDEAVRPCDCEAGHNTFGDNVFKLINAPMPFWKHERYFCGQPDSKFKLIRVMPRVVEVGHKVKFGHGEIQPAKRIYVPYQNTGKIKEAVFYQYVSKGGA